MQWVVTEHRQIVVESEYPPSDDAVVKRWAFGTTHPEFVVSDHTTRNVYPVAQAVGA